MSARLEAPFKLLARSLALAALCACLPVSGALAATVSKVAVPQGTLLVYQGATPTTNDVVHMYRDSSGTRIIFSNLYGEGNITPTADCPHVSSSRPEEVSCDLTGIDAVLFDGQDGNDEAKSADPNDLVTVPLLLDGGPGNDVLGGGAGDDLLVGGEGNDSLDDLPGADELDGGNGNDTLTSIYFGATDVFDGGDGTDEVGMTRNAPFDISLDGQANDGLSGEGDNVTAENVKTWGDGAATGTSDEAGLVKVVGWVGKSAVAAGKGTLEGAGSITVKVRFSKAAKRKFARKRRIVVTLLATTTDAAGQLGTRSAKLMLRR